MTLDIEKIKAAAKAATQQPWILNKARPTPEFKGYISGGGEFVELDVGSHGGFGLLVWRMEDEEVSPKCQANARHIATANPQAVLDLITRLEEAEQRAELAKTTMTQYETLVHRQAKIIGDFQTKLEAAESRWAVVPEGHTLITSDRYEELEAAEKDAAKYFWLCEKHAEGDEQWFVYGARTRDMDSEIDAAMKESEK